MYVADFKQRLFGYSLSTVTHSKMITYVGEVKGYVSSFPESALQYRCKTNHFIELFKTSYTNKNTFTYFLSTETNTQSYVPRYTHTFLHLHTHTPTHSHTHTLTHSHIYTLTNSYTRKLIHLHTYTLKLKV